MKKKKKSATLETRSRKTYSPAFKKKVALEAYEGGKTCQEVAAEYGVAPSMVTKWKKALVEGGFGKETKEPPEGERRAPQAA